MRAFRNIAAVAAMTIPLAGIVPLAAGPAAARAQTDTSSAPGSTAAVVAGTPAPATTIDGTVSGTDGDCAWSYKWRVDSGSGGDSEVEWTNNPCGLKIEERSWCADVGSDAGAWETSGIVKSTYVWDQSICGLAEVITGAQEHHTQSDGSWTTYKEFWQTQSSSRTPGRGAPE